ncbi:MAG TPA: methyltransferase domain-containing protein, partial [Thermodesulfovibrionales bacterium]|nr:methyltransferase domain-containing protein [Thermodesulfovibrionales bacterium]
MPLINIVIPTRERADTLYWTLKTCLQQDYESCQIWVSDNCSSDNTEEVVRSFGDNRVRYIRTPRRVSMSHNWEFALEHLEEGYAIVIGDDDGLVLNSLQFLGDVLEQTGAEAVRPPNIVYCWPEHPEDHAKGMLTQVSLREGYECIDSGVILNDIARNLEYYHPFFLNLPTIYHGCVSVDLIRRIRRRDGAFLRSCCPDMYSAVITAAEVDSYVKLHRPICINGMSRSSTGISATLPGALNSAAEQFFAEHPIPFHSSLMPVERRYPSVLSRPILIADQFIYAREKNPRVPSVNIENVIRQSVRSLHGGRWKSRYQYDVVIENTRCVARLNGLEDMAEELIRKLPYVENAPMVRGRTFFDVKSGSANIDTLSFGVKNVYDASHLIHNLLQSSNAITDNDSLNRCLKAATAVYPGDSDRQTEFHPFLNPLLSKDTMDNYLVRTSILKSLKEFLSVSRGILLDIGCGEMPYRQLIAGQYPGITRYVGMDIDNPKYQQKRRPDLFWDGRTIPMDDCSVDCAIATELFEHLSDIEGVLREIGRVLKPGGNLFFTVPFLWPLHDMPQDEYRYTPFSLERHLKRAGFDHIRLTSLGGWDASLAQMIGLWVKRRPMSVERRTEFIEVLYPFYKELVEADMKNEPLTYDDMMKNSAMISGLAGSAAKPVGQKTGHSEHRAEVECPICGGSFDSFLPYGVIKRDNALCPSCGSLERHRLLWLYLKAKTDLFSGKKKLLDIAPTMILSEKMKRLPNVDYLSIDKFSSVAMRKMDITCLDLQDDTFDSILCYHVLEHVPDDRRAMRELLRVLKPGGWAILQVPLKPGLQKTMEGVHISDPAERRRLFGQEDHVRYYGLDYKDRLEEEGFAVRCDPFAKTLSLEEINRYSVFRDEDIYFCSKPRVQEGGGRRSSGDIRCGARRSECEMSDKSELIQSKKEQNLPEPVLAIVCPQVGAASETFIRKHIERLLPGRTVVITGGLVDGSWLKAPVLKVPHTRGWARYSPNAEASIVRFVKDHNVTHILCEFGSVGTGMVELNERVLHLPLYVHFHGQDASEEL